MMQTLEVLSEPNRFRIVELLRSGPRPVGEIKEQLNLNQPQVSKHLRVLRDAGIVDARVQGQRRIYALSAAPMRDLHRWIERYRGLWEVRFDALDALAEEITREEKCHGRKERK